MAEKVSELQVVVSADTSALTRGLAEANSSVTGFGSKMGGLLATGAMAAGVGIAAGLAVGIKSAGDLEQAVANISTIKPEIDNSQVFASLNEMSTRIPQTASALGDALYDVFSSVNVTQEEGLRLTEIFSKGAVGAQTDAKTFGTAAMGVMNAYGLSVEDAGHISDVFFNTIAQGVVTGPQLASSLGPVTAAAKAAGVSIDEMGAMIVGVTKQGGEPAQNINNLNNLLQKITTKEAQKQLVDLGVVTTDNTGKFRPQIEVLRDLRDRLSGMTESARANALQAIFPDAQARQGAQAIMDQMAAVDLALETNRTSTGSTEAAYIKMNATFNSQSILLGNTLKAIGTTIGGELLPMITPLITQFAKDLPGAFATAKAMGTDAMRQLSDAWGTVKQVFEGNWSPDASIEPLALAAGNAATKIKELRDALQAVSDKAGQMGAFDSVASGLETIRTEADLAGDRLNEIAESFARLQTVLGGAATATTASASSVNLLARAFEVGVLVSAEFIDATLTVIKVGVDLAAGLAAVARGFYALASGDIPTFLKAGDLAEQAFMSAGRTITDFNTNSLERARQGFQAVSGAATAEMPATAAAVEAGMSEASQAASAGFLEMASAADADLGAMSAAATARFAELSASAGTGTAEAVAAVDTGMAAVGPAVDAGMSLAVAGVEAGGVQMTAAAGEGAANAVAAVEGQTGAASGAGNSVGSAIGAGLRGGILGWVGQVAAAAVDLVSTAINAARAEADAHSPSKKTEKLGKDLADGLEIGLASSNIGEDMQAKIRDFIEATREYIPVAGQIARVEQEIKDIRYSAQTDALFRGQDMITIDSELLRLKKEQTEEERRLLPIRQDLAAADRDVRDIANGSLGDRTRLLELETQHKQLRLQSLDLEKQLLAAGKDETRKKQIQAQIDALRDQDRALGIEQDRIRTTNDLASTSARMRSLGLGDILAAEERNNEAIGRAIAILGAEKSVFEANEATIKNATDNEIGYRNRLIAVFTAEGKPIADRITAGKALLEQLHNEGKISDELYNSIKKLTDQTTAAGVATTGMGAAVQMASPALAAVTAQQNAMAQSAADLARNEAQAAGSVSALASSLGKLPSWFTPKGGSSSSSGSLFTAPSLSVPTYTPPQQSGGYPGGSIVPGQTTVPGGSIIPMSASSSGGGRQDSMSIDLKIDGRTAENIVVVGYGLAVRRGRMPALDTS